MIGPNDWTCVVNVSQSQYRVDDADEEVTHLIFAATARLRSVHKFNQIIGEGHLCLRSEQMMASVVNWKVW